MYFCWRQKFQLDSALKTFLQMFPTVYLCFLPSGDWDGKLPEAERQVLNSQEFQTSHLLPPLCWAQSRVGLQYRLLTGWKASTKKKISEKDEGTITSRPGTIPVALKVCANISWMKKLGFREDSAVGVVRPGWGHGPPLWTSLLCHGLRELLRCPIKPSRILHCSR